MSLDPFRGRMARCDQIAAIANCEVVRERLDLNKNASVEKLYAVISSGRTARRSAIDLYSAKTICRVCRLSRPLVSGSESSSTARISDAMGPMNASGIHIVSSRAENQ